MTLESALIWVSVAEVWLWLGALVGVALVLSLGVFDPAARGAWAFRPLLIPGAMLLWPLVLWRAAAALSPDDDWRVRHSPPLAGQAALALAMVAALAAALALGWSVRQAPPTDAAPALLEPPR